MSGTLYIVSTPIGNLGDLTFRALRVLKEADVIAAEDTRHSRKLLTHYGISKPLISYWGEREKVKSAEIVERLHSGQSVALISDAGTPGISDPGAVLIKKAIEENIQVVSIPGPSALIAALSLSGLHTEEFIFIGFLPTKESQRQKILKDLSLERRTLVFYEAPHRILQTLKDMEKIFLERKAALIKEITKIHEEVLRGSIPEILTKIKKTTIAGEYVIAVDGRTEEKKLTTEDAISEVSALMKKGLGRKEAVKKIADAYGLSKKELYDKSLM
ncbi:MAG: 16S rRNA (cytidine(1402)-2'-O)-methyltransferase [Nitrospirae bacterium CG_4_10_14_0_8_um_filter_41_23]|nr:16S rRNA (cytidine(1402)-2'-O)-methyltransferase [Nitrospirota bacterium]OIP59266.1 MAG: 16S rRNA (cytidine(1402)-2'-O)-methyltransferase [Nitrospirae bacterium CG2_30_41_42]PIQ94320.1 MAG: 16S rRNA (cytidine(1402)-2'-O)-methyltransferase [Nitrospirae bacterium CG11_big_fil_rev_8_21_14_0_20_41_14]PIV44175.1 MAG: 16S rRNA (cytidine(1402)-2'-O)-methyltransferase [Nitrospirae bacterium CG02_land_8_20_14_3_00_41_53]PIW87302.1 MAG: 16S rRNA (cytidine(1402)-2'-O)-methyltransferase [Nitrospirae bac